MYNQFAIITPAAAAEGRAAAEKLIRIERRRADVMRRLADLLDGRYITKRVIPEIEKALPGTRVYMGSEKHINHIWINITHNPGAIYDRDESDEIPLADAETRRCSGEELRRRAAELDKSAADRAQKFAVYDDAIAQYNALARQYAALREFLDPFIKDMPYADYKARDELRRAKSPDELRAFLKA